MPKSIVTIDGPSASGKSTVARQVAEILGGVYVDSGSVYRGITWQVLREGKDPGKPDEVIACLRRMKLEFVNEGRAARLRVNGIDPGAEIRSDAVQERVSEVAAIPEVRQTVNRRLRATTRFGDIVMEGRDIGSVVFPTARHKFYLDAVPEERARRRHLEKAAGEGASGVHTVMDALKRRDAKDSGRQTAPLKVPEGAVVVDTTGISIEQVVERIVARVRETR